MRVQTISTKVIFKGAICFPGECFRKFQVKHYRASWWVNKANTPHKSRSKSSCPLQSLNVFGL